MKRIIPLLIFLFQFTTGYSQSITDGLVAYYPMDGNANDAGPNGLHGTMTGLTAAPNINGIPGKALSFTNTVGPGSPPPTSYITLPASSLLQMSGDISFSFWMKVDPGDVAGYNQWIYNYGFCGTTLTYQNYLGGRFNAAQGCGTFADGFGYNTNQWWHFAFSFVRATGQYRIYRNGILILNYTDAANSVSYDGVPYIGRYRQNLLGLRGLMDEFRIYNRIITQAEVTMLYNDNLPPVINSFTPQTGSTGTTVTISGVNFTGATAVSFGAVPASSFTVNNATTITATVAAGASGNVSVTTPNGTGSLAGFTYCTPLVPSVSISANPGNIICSGTSVTFTATPVNGGTPIYQWKKNGGNVGINSNTYSTSSLITGDIINCIMTSDLACAAPTTATSNSITMTVNSIPSATNPSIAGSNNVCPGTTEGYSVTGFTAADSYSWLLPSGWSGTSSMNSINATTGGNGGTISVTAMNGCGSATAVNLSVSVKPQYNITPSAGPGGIISPNIITGVCEGENQAFTIMPDGGYHIETLIVDGMPQASNNSYVFFNVTSQHTISATFAPDTYAIDASAGPGGTISPLGTTLVNPGDDQVYTITPDDCYSIADVIADGVSQGAVSTFTFNAVNAPHTISVSFTLNGPYTITVSAGANGSVTPVTGSVNCGGTATYSITADACYHIADVLVDGVSQGAINTYTFTNVQSNHSISASFVLNPALVTPGPLSGPVNVCPYIGTGAQLSFSVPLDPYATGYAWTIPPTCSLVSQDMNNITITVGPGFIANANKQVRVRGLSPCGNSPQVIFYLLAQLPGTPQPISTSATNICPAINTMLPVTYTIPKVAAASGYIWSAQASTTIINHPNGPGANDTIVTVTFGSGFSSSAITVQSVNDCGTSAARSLLIARNNPSVPGLISGPTNACPYISPNGSNANYSIAAVNNAVSYTWTVPAGSTGLSGQGTNNFSFIYPAGFGNGTVSVTATNGCGTSGVRNLSISTLNPATPSVIDVIPLLSCPNRRYSYTLSGMPANATSVQWTWPLAATYVSGQGTFSLVLDYPANAVTGNVTAQAVNNCGASTIRSSVVKLPACEIPPPFSKSAIGNVNSKQDHLNLKIYPNPSAASFNLEVITAGRESISFSVTDMAGRMVSEQVVLPHNSIEFGSNLKPGIYILRIKQGKTLQLARIVKL